MSSNGDQEHMNMPESGGETNHHSLPLPEPARAHVTWKSRLSTAAGVAGNVMEWYDFAVFGYFSDILGDVFFPPNQTGDNALVESFLVFGTGFLMRPIGGLMLGYLGDTFGRKMALEHSIFIMASATFLMGCLPTYDAIGYGSTALLVIVRLMQGASVGGQLMSSLVFTLERQPKDQWGYYGAIVQSTATVGTLIGGIVAYAVRESLDSDALMSWGWRIPFFIGSTVIFPGMYLKYHVEDTPVLHAPPPVTEASGSESSSDKVNPIKEVFSSTNRRSLISCAMIVALGAGGFYLSFVWMAIYMETILDPPIEHAFAVNSVALFISGVITYPSAGWLSDQVGRMRVMVVGGVLMIFAGPIAIGLISVGNAAVAFFSQLLLGAGLSLFGAPSNAWIVENFPPEIRLTSVSVGYNAALAIIGGFTPAIATVLVDHVGQVSPGFYISVLAILSLCGLYISPREGGNASAGAKTQVEMVAQGSETNANEII